MSWLMHHGINGKLEANSPSLDDYKRPLPPPPHGSYWEKQQDNSWEIKQFNKSESEDCVEIVAESVLEHIVLPEDTIQGICLRYGSSVVTLRQANLFSGNAFRSRKTLRIPIEKGMNIKLQKNEPEIILQRFKNLTNEQTLEAKFYLEEHNYNLERAYEAWVQDQQWASEHIDENGEYNNDIEDDEIVSAGVSNIDPTFQVVTPFEISMEEPTDVFSNINDRTPMLSSS